MIPEDARMHDTFNDHEHIIEVNGNKVTVSGQGDPVYMACCEALAISGGHIIQFSSVGELCEKLSGFEVSKQSDTTIYRLKT